MKTWVQVINYLFEQMFGSDFLESYYDKDHGTRVEDTVTSSILKYCHDNWESQYGVHTHPQPLQDLSGMCHPIVTNLDVDTDMLNEPTPPQDLSGECHPIAINLDLDSAMLNEPAPILSSESEPAKCNLKCVTCNSSRQLKAAVVIEDQGETILPQQTT